MRTNEYLRETTTWLRIPPSPPFISPINTAHLTSDVGRWRGVRDEEPGADARVLPVLRAGEMDRSKSSVQRQGTETQINTDAPFFSGRNETHSRRVRSVSRERRSNEGVRADDAAFGAA